ncbi:hypothetical protein THRCLA_04963 [Thraustotheca clavata]|uniref:Cilia- and flagella-associated protein 45 n=1 Tax=Thraustotheca clavata TaxID=74557 RepID=A0A1V9ZXD9_9STRA|nr:hypothetical protein THRCLA_04963 [Thraustotheca clavata]
MDMEMETREESLRGFLGGQFAPHGLHAIDTTHREGDEGYNDYYERNRTESYRDDKTWMYAKPDANRMQRSSSYPTESFPSTAYRKDAKPDFAISYTPTAARNPHPNISPTGGMSPFRAHDEVANGIMNSTSIPEVGNNDTQKHLRSKNLPSSILFNSGRWSIEEHNRFVQGLGAFPHGVLNRWRKISKAVGTRTVLQTRTHAQKFFRKLQKQDELKAMNEEENYMPNGEDLKSKVKPKQGTGPVTSYSNIKSSSGTKDEPQTYQTNAASGRLSDPGQYEATNPARSLTPLSNLTDHHVPRTSFSQQQPQSNPNTFPSNLFPSISISAPTNAHLPSSIATPTTESSRAFSNMSLGPRTTASPNNPTPPQTASSFPPTRGNDQWVDWLLSNIDTIVTKNGRGPPGDEGRPHAKSTADLQYHRSSNAPSGRTFRSASESALHYRQDPNEQSQQQQHGSWEATYSSNYNTNHHGSSYYSNHEERQDNKDKSQNEAFYEGTKYSMPGDTYIATAQFLKDMVGGRLSNISQAGKEIAKNNVVHAGDLERIRSQSVIVTDRDMALRLKEAEQVKMASRAKAQERKNRMVEKELQVRARREQYATQMELEAERNSVLTKDDIQRHAHLDSYKFIQSLVAKASAATGCDEQLEEQEQTRQQEEAYNQRIERMMDKDRTNDLLVKKAAESAAREKRVEARNMLEGQILERQKQKIRDEEAKAIEAKKILQVYKQYELEEQAKTAAHRTQAQNNLQRIAATNEEIKIMKAEALRQERHEEQVAAKYLRDKAREEERIHREKEAIRKSKELRIAKLRAQQEKAQDKQQAQDEFKAKKAFEANEKEMRQKEVDERRQKRELAETIDRERKQQEWFKREEKLHIEMQEKQSDDVAKQIMDREDFKAQQERERKADDHKKYLELFNQQFTDNATRRKNKAALETNDNAANVRKMAKETIVVDKIRMDAIQKLRKQGVPEEYLRDLKKLDIHKL